MAGPAIAAVDTLCFVGVATEEWQYAWSRHRQRWGDTTALGEGYEVWHYMGSYVCEAHADWSGGYTEGPFASEWAGRGYYHEFRHRNHPEFHRRIYWRVFASHSFQLDGAWRARACRDNPYAPGAR